ncbi:UbiE/COQ5 methyltransferase [Cladochytrium replicatum]|nr:UbiE/COQ5 methyltransferase [Cladochytrium replicatum]
MGRSTPFSAAIITQPGYTHFGFKTVPEDEKQNLVGKVFSSVAKNYDIMNDLMSGGVHRLWKDHYVSKLAPGPDTLLLDVAGGTGDIAFRFLNHCRKVHGPSNTAKVTVVDINPDMLAVGKSRAAARGFRDSQITFLEGDAQLLVDIPDASIDAFTIAFGIRNCTRIRDVIAQAHRVLKPGGRFAVLEFCPGPSNPVLAQLYDVYSFNVIPAIGTYVAQDRESYEYLVESIRKFPRPDEFAQWIRDGGFTVVGKGYEELTFGVAAVHSGFKL